MLATGSVRPTPEIQPIEMTSPMPSFSRGRTQLHDAGLSPAVPREESEWVLRDRGLRNSLQTRGVTGGGEGVVFAMPRVPTGSRVVSIGLPEDSTYFCRKRQAGFAADVYRKSTVYRTSG